MNLIHVDLWLLSIGAVLIVLSWVVLSSYAIYQKRKHSTIDVAYVHWYCAACDEWWPLRLVMVAGQLAGAIGVLLLLCILLARLFGYQLENLV